LALRRLRVLLLTLEETEDYFRGRQVAITRSLLEKRKIDKSRSSELRSGLLAGLPAAVVSR